MESFDNFIIRADFDLQTRPRVATRHTKLSSGALDAFRLDFCVSESANQLWAPLRDAPARFVCVLEAKPSVSRL
jgi:hypothetical protein